jgi:hypothetical protein
VIRQALEDHRALLERAGLTLRTSFARQPLPVRGDRLRLSQVVANLLGNAAKFTRRGGSVVVAVRADNGHAALSVRDNGIGIGPNALPRGVKHWLSSCEYLAGREYLKRHDQALRVLYGEVLKEFGLVEHSTAWYNIRVEPVRENTKALIVWNKKIATHQKVEHRWLDLRIEDKMRKVIWILDMACPSDDNVTKKEQEKRLNYVDLLYEMRTQRPGWRIEVVPLVVGVMGGMGSLKFEVGKLLRNDKRCR